MTAPSATDGCQQTDLYKYVVPDDLAKDAKVIFNDGGSASSIRDPASRAWTTTAAPSGGTARPPR